jgi:hypothetical protein
LCDNYAEIKLKEHGADSIEVTDNGSGVEAANFQALSELCQSFHYFFPKPALLQL